MSSYIVSHFSFFFQSLFSLGKILTLSGRQTRTGIMAEIPIGMGPEIPGVMVEEKFDKADKPFFLLTVWFPLPARSCDGQIP